MKRLLANYTARTPNSKKLWEVALRLSPGGVQSNARFSSPYPIFLKKGSGSKFYDVDGNEYIDYQLGGGPLILGHAHPSVVSALKSQLEMGWQLYPANENEIKLSEKIVKYVPCAEMVRFTNSGTEATLYTLRLARAFTKRKKIIKFEGAYHGHHDLLLISVAPPLEQVVAEERPIPIPGSAGILPCLAENLIVLPFNSIEMIEKVLEEEGSEIAAVIAEPFQRAIPPKEDFLSKLRSLTQKHGVLLIFDEVVTGFRPCLGGAQEHYKVKADLAALGKIIGGGFTIGAFAGRKEIMELVDPRRKGEENYVFHSGTMVANPAATVAGLATIQELEKDGAYDRLASIGEQLAGALKDAAEDNKVDAQVVLGCGSIWGIHFTDKEVHDYRSAATADREKLTNFIINMRMQGIYVVSKGYISTAHTDEDVEKTTNAFYKSMKKLA